MGKLFSSKLSVVASIALVGSLVLSGCGGGGSSDSSDSTTSTSTTSSGTVIDGYVSGAKVYYNGKEVGLSDANGKFTVNDIPEGAILSFKGGVDVSTGEIFEGVLKAPAGADGEDIVATPITTIVSSLVENGASHEDAKATVAKKLGVSVESIEADPVEVLKSGTDAQKAEAAQVIVHSLVIQKTAETFASAVGSSDEAFDACMDAIAEKIESSTNIETAMSDTAELATDMAIKLKDTSTDTLISEKLDAVSDAAKTVVETVSAIDETALTGADSTAQLENISKAIEVVTSTIEKKVEAIASSEDVASIEVAQTATEEATKAVVMLGGVTGVATKIEAQIEATGVGKTIDASSFAETFLADDVIAIQADTFDTLVDSGLTLDMVAEVGSKVAEGSDTSIADIVTSVVDNAKENGTISADVVIDVANITEAVQTASDAADEASLNAGESAVVVDETVTETDNDDDTATETGTDNGDETATETETDNGDETATTVTSNTTTSSTTTTTPSNTTTPTSITLGSFAIANNDVDISSTGVLGSVNVDKLTGANYDAIKNKLDDLYSFTYTIPVNSEDIANVENKEIKLGVYLKRTSEMSGDENAFLLLSIPAKITFATQNGKKYVQLAIKDAGLAKMYFTTENNDNFNEATAKNSSDWISKKVEVKEGAEYTQKINLGKIIAEFFSKDDDVSNTMKTHIYNKSTNAGSYKIGIFLDANAYAGTGSVDFTNDNESVDLFTNLGLESSSDIATKIKSDFGMSGSTVKGYTGILNVQ